MYSSLSSSGDWKAEEGEVILSKTYLNMSRDDHIIYIIVKIVWFCVHYTTS